MLTDRERDVLKRSRKGETFEQIGKSYGVTRERIRQIHSKATKKQQNNTPKWNLIKDGLPPVGVPLIVAVEVHSFARSENNEIKMVYPVLYQKDFWKDRWCFYNCTKGEVIKPEYATVVAWVEFPSTTEVETMLKEMEKC